MTAIELVLLVLSIEGVALALILAAIFGYAIWSRSARAARGRRLSAARALIASHLEERRMPANKLAELRALPRDDQRRIFYEVAPSVGESERAWLRHIASQLGLLAELESDLQSSRWHVRLWASRLLTLLDADPAVLHPLFRDENENIRAQAGSYVAQHPTSEGIDELIRMLADRSALCRFAAKDALMRLGNAATPVLVARLRNPTDPQTTLMLEVACATASHRYLAAAAAHYDSTSAATRLLVTRLLRGIGGPEAADYLTRLAGDPSPEVREAAAEAIGHLNHWVASATVATLLDDAESRVRLSAALALDHLGPAGELFLRRAKAKGSERAAAAASRILDDVSRFGAARAPAT